ncbi:MAG TPA: hypothetical protein VNZ52_12645 [Candidatus Thermoplasmatota archaeon]|nr:hypothetical protein [Candidatus Thermoplasmatota archaeon]
MRLVRRLTLLTLATLLLASPVSAQVTTPAEGPLQCLRPKVYPEWPMGELHEIVDCTLDSVLSIVPTDIRS